MNKLPPMPPNQGLNFYPWFEPITAIYDAIARWEKGYRPKPEELTAWPKLRDFCQSNP